MNVPPSDSENTAWPIAAIITRGVRSDRLELEDVPLDAGQGVRQRQRAPDEHDAG